MRPVIDVSVLMKPNMVRAILQEVREPGTGKTQTRRPAWRTDDSLRSRVKEKATPWMRLYWRWEQHRQRGEHPLVLLWVREPHAFRVVPRGIVYRADSPDWPGPWVPGIHLPRDQSRLTLEVTDVRAQRVQDISEEDAKAEGASAETYFNTQPSYRRGFETLWGGIHNPADWAKNPEVVAVTFKPHLRNINTMDPRVAEEAA